MVDDKYDIYIVIPLTAFILFIIAAIGDFPSILEKAREAEVKSNCHTIQLAIEKYALYNDLQYPQYLFGGDSDGWNPQSEYACHLVRQGRKLPPPDPLLDGGYLSTYPRNPFIAPGKGIYTTIFWTGGTYHLGWGDPRFGYNGEIMGNCLNDPLNLWQDMGMLTNFANTIPNNVYTESNYIKMVQLNTPVNPFYAMGGLPEWSHEGMGKSTREGWLNAFWPGEFFYRVGRSIKYTSIYREDKNYRISEIKHQIFDRYLLGGYGSSCTRGIDCIRLTLQDCTPADNKFGWLNEYYEINPNFGWKVRLSTPEVFGGGGKGNLPTFPYYDTDGQWIYGAPDGFPDGIIILLTPGGVYDDTIV